MQDKKLPPKLGDFQSLLEVEGQTLGLIGPKEVGRIFTRHILNSLTLLNLLDDKASSFQPRTLIDIGSGAGFPGVPVAIMRPSLEVILIDSMQRRVDWLHHVKDKLELNNVKVLHGNSRDFEGAVYADYITARAVAPLDKLVPLLNPFRRKNSKILLLKGQNVRTELHNASRQIEKAKLSIELHENVMPTCVYVAPELDKKEIMTNVLMLS
ncbi:MAG: 16S rRNA (guanine(527)-N(7))-methyltransferase RsmG [Bifidobacteriaceae bacterium]|jgi:16S rRNA (guanine527-N7)-methyltransferase|nr:16S rRNA (guanine(527)-N(7))-methyltransferase RsmG [Bifidobacteriaceae bacterium]